ncbi:hypothetical protein PENSPDRAFT_671511 [Peniophora sp. CONT]|nr:hypothetical protein PENSPDRAFT_671511 [Peniophora sp. CONT]
MRAWVGTWLLAAKQCRTLCPLGAEGNTVNIVVSDVNVDKVIEQHSASFVNVMTGSYGCKGEMRRSVAGRLNVNGRKNLTDYILPLDYNGPHSEPHTTQCIIEVDRKNIVATVQVWNIEEFALTVERRVRQMIVGTRGRRTKGQCYKVIQRQALCGAVDVYGCPHLGCAVIAVKLWDEKARIWGWALNSNVQEDIHQAHAKAPITECGQVRQAQPGAHVAVGRHLTVVSACASLPPEVHHM